MQFDAPYPALLQRLFFICGKGVSPFMDFSSLSFRFHAFSFFPQPFLIEHAGWKKHRPVGPCRLWFREPPFRCCTFFIPRPVVLFVCCRHPVPLETKPVAFSSSLYVKCVGSKFALCNLNLFFLLPPGPLVGSPFMLSLVVLYTMVRMSVKRKSCCTKKTWRKKTDGDRNCRVNTLHRV